MQSVIMPKLGLTMEEGTIIRWLVEEGDEVNKGDVLFEAETDKSVNEVEAPVSGKLGKILFHDGNTVDVLAVIGYILEPNEEPPDQWPEESGLPADTIIKEDSDEIKKQAVATPVAERMARELGVELDKIEGSGAGGKIKKDDVLQAGESSSTKTTTTTKRILASPRAKRLAIQKNISLNQVRGSGPKGRITEQDVIDFINSKEKPQLSRLQQITAKRMVESFTKAPHFYLKIEVDASELVDWHKKISPTLERKYQIHTTISDLLIFLVARTLKNHPRVNSHWIQDDIQINERVNLGFAVALEDGLTVPVIKDAHHKTVLDIARERTILVEKATNGKLTFDDLEGGTFTLSNLGMLGIDEFIAIINPPESAILAVGQIKQRSVVLEGHTVVKPIVYLTLSIDHRVLDGAVSAKFLGDLKDAIEAPEEYFIFQTH
jgi:pyruvate dehydrogenase E2 component (dihydrolipoamide acetyltransferase)